MGICEKTNHSGYYKYCQKRKSEEGDGGVKEGRKVIKQEEKQEL